MTTNNISSQAKVNTAPLTQTQGSGNVSGVKQEPSPLSRLDKIKGTPPPSGNIFNRIFDSVDTKTARTARSLDSQAETLFTRLQPGENGKLDMGGVMQAMKSLRLHTDRLGELNKVTVDHADTLQIALAGKLGQMDNAELLGAFHSFMSSDMDQLRSMLETEIREHPQNVEAKRMLEDLGVIEATIMMEMSTRVARSRPQPDETVPTLQDRLFARSSNPGKDVLMALYKKDGLTVQEQTAKVSDRALETLVNAGGRSAVNRDKLEGKGAQRLQQKGMDSLTMKQVGDAFRSSELTINLPLSNLLGVGRKVSPIKDCTGLKNMFQWGKDPTKNVAVEKRDIAEREFFPALEKDALDPDERPLYGALNVGRGDTGAAESGYGEVSIVLKPEVKQRCTYTRDDTFNIPICSVNPKNLKAFTDGLDGMIAKLSPEMQKFMTDNKGENRQKLVDHFASQSGGKPFSVYQYYKVIDQVLPGAPFAPLKSDAYSGDCDIIAQYSERMLIDEKATHEQIVGFNDIESLVPFFEEVRLDQVLTAVTNPQRNNIKITNYIEAQIHGPISFSEDIEAIKMPQGAINRTARDIVRANHPEIKDGNYPAQEILQAKIDVTEQLRMFCKQNGIRLELCDEQKMMREQNTGYMLFDRFSNEHKNAVLLADKFIGGTDERTPGFTELPGLVKQETGFTKDIPQTVIDKVKTGLADEALKAVNGDRAKLTPELMRQVATGMIKAYVRSEMNAVKEQNSTAINDFFRPDTKGPNSFSGVLDMARRDLGFRDELNPANLNMLSSEIFKACGKSNNGAETMSPERIATIAKDVTEKFIGTKQTLLAELDKLTFDRPEHKATWQAFVLGSSTLREPSMLAALYEQSLKARDLVREMLADDGFTPAKFLAGVKQFTAGAMDAQDGVFQQLQRDIGRDDTYLFLDRVFSLAVSTASLSSVQAQRLYTELTGETVGEMRFQMVKQGVDPHVSNNMSDALLLLARNLGREIEIPRTDVDKAMGGALSGAEKSGKTPSTTLQTALDDTVKVRRVKAFPAPGVKVDGSFSGFRDKELPAILDKYRENEQKFDRTQVHGRLHVSRALIYSKALANLYKQAGATVDTHALYRAIGFHDSGREGNGKDVYEGASAKNAVEFLKSQGITSGPYLKETANCITCGKNIETLEGGIMNSADSFEILRTRGLQGFDTGKLWVMGSPVSLPGGQVLQPDTGLRDQLLKEIHSFIMETDPSDSPERQQLNHVMLSGNTSGVNLEELSQQAKEGDQKILEEDWKIPSDQYFQNIEKALTQNPEKYPLLHQLYTMAD